MGHCKNEARELDCLCCRQVNAMLISWSAREASPHVDFMGNCLTVSYTYLLYLPSRWVFLFVSGTAERNKHAGESKVLSFSSWF